jgi:hypothetical protein
MDLRPLFAEYFPRKVLQRMVQKGPRMAIKNLDLGGRRREAHTTQNPFYRSNEPNIWAEAITFPSTSLQKSFHVTPWFKFKDSTFSA